MRKLLKGLIIFLSIIGTITLGFVVYSFIDVYNMIQSTINRDTTKQIIIPAYDKKTQVTTPEGWRINPKLFSELGKSDIHADIAISILTKKNQMYFTSITENKKVFTENFRLQEYFESDSKRILETYSENKLVNKWNTKIDGNSTIQAEYSIVAGTIKFTYLTTIIETEENFYKLTAWTPSYLYENNKNELRNISNSFKILSDK